MDPEDSKALEDAENTSRIGFGSSNDPENNIVFLEEKELLDYISPHSDYRSSYFYDKLTERDQLLYRSMEYAMESGCDKILISENLCPEKVRLENITLYLAMDSPLVEQNLQYNLYPFTTQFPLSDERTDLLVPFDGYCLVVGNFTKELFDKKLLAIEKAKEILETMPEGLSDIDKAEFLYRYIVNNVEYELYNSDNLLHPYLHDALVLGKTHCDGTSNAYSLLLNMAGIDCFEKIANAESGEENGHTWNCANIDGNWYNFDATTDKISLAEVEGLGGGCYFAFADDLLDYSAEFEKEMPLIEKGYYINQSAHFSSEADMGLLDTMISAFEASGNKYAVLTFDSFDYDKCESALQVMVDRLNISVRTVTFEGKKRTILYIEIA